MTAGSALPDHKPTLKIGFPVMLIGNIDLFSDHVSGAHYVLKPFRRRLLPLESLTVDNARRILA